MFVGHALLAFAVAALVADWRGWGRRDALAVGVVAGAFATLPDVDIAYAVFGLVQWIVIDASGSVPTAFWDASRRIHRSVTHSLVVGAIAAPTFGLVALRTSGRRRRIALAGITAIFGGLVAIAAVYAGLLATLVMGLFLGVGTVIGWGAARGSTLSPTVITLAALWGLWSHPWGDLATGAPPDLLFPVGAPVLESRLLLHSDPTLQLLGAFGLELATIWLALAAVFRLTDRQLLPAIDRGASIGVLYGVAALIVTPPTLDVSYHFVFSILGVGLFCGTVRVAPISVPRGRFVTEWRSRLLPRGIPGTDAVLAAAMTAVAGITLALLAYTASYVVLGAT